MKVYEAEKVISLWEKYHHYIAVKAEHFDYELKRLPTVEAEPVRHCQLIFVGMDEKGNGLYECTQCHVGGVVNSTIPVRYCQYCGARICGDNYDAERKEE